MDFDRAYSTFLYEFGEGREMVLSTSLDDHVTSRMMSVVLLDGKFYFQTDWNSRKYEQLFRNRNVALCVDNVQIEGTCAELGRPAASPRFCVAYRERFPAAFERYSTLECERAFSVTPALVRRWFYLDGVPHTEIFDVAARTHELRKYEGS